jgi:hypothetical protein
MAVRMSASRHPTATEREAGQAAGFGGTLPARRLRLISFRLLKKGGLLGFAIVDYLGLVIVDCPLQITHGRVWCGLPGKPVLDADGHHIKLDGKGQYAAVNKWRDRAHSDRFSDRVVELVRQQYPGALE